MSRQWIIIRGGLLALLLVTIGGLCPTELVARQVERQVMTPPCT